ncbi:hypothetical protein ACFVWF_33630 [Rhodococcus qingshengii]|uniref:hypothetical protein n=1 Tax=Rhodococcus qingshengii TaxID=334542 RepID=UPI0036D97116
MGMLPGETVAAQGERTWQERRPQPLTDNAVISAITGQSSSRHLPWHSPHALNKLVREHMTVEDRHTLAKLLTQE